MSHNHYINFLAVATAACLCVAHAGWVIAEIRNSTTAQRSPGWTSDMTDQGREATDACFPRRWYQIKTSGRRHPLRCTGVALLRSCRARSQPGLGGAQHAVVDRRPNSGGGAPPIESRNLRRSGVRLLLAERSISSLTRVDRRDVATAATKIRDPPGALALPRFPVRGGFDHGAKAVTRPPVAPALRGLAEGRSSLVALPVEPISIAGTRGQLHPIGQPVTPRTGSTSSL